MTKHELIAALALSRAEVERLIDVANENAQFGREESERANDNARQANEAIKRADAAEGLLSALRGQLEVLVTTWRGYLSPPWHAFTAVARNECADELDALLTDASGGSEKEEKSKS